MKMFIHLNSYQHWVIFAFYIRIHLPSILTLLRQFHFFKSGFFFASIWQELNNIKISVHLENVDKHSKLLSLFPSTDYTILEKCFISDILWMKEHWIGIYYISSG